MRLYGKNSVMERLRFNPGSVRKIFLEQGQNGLAAIHKKARQRNIQIVSIMPSKMMKLARNKNTQGVLANVDEYTYVDYSELINISIKRKKTLLFLDGITDPQNLGAIIRTAACLGNFSIVIPKHDSVEVTETVLRIASGADNYVGISKVSNLVNAIKIAKDEKFSILGSIVSREGESLFDIELPKHLGVVIGSEQKGIRNVVKKYLDQEVFIPMQYDTLSFNVAHATTILCYEIAKQKNKQ